MGTKITVSNEATGKQIELPILEGAEGPATIDCRPLYKQLGCFSFDPGFVSTASCESKITFIDGDEGLLSYRGYPIDQLAEHSNFEEVASLLFYGELPTRAQLDKWTAALERERLAPDDPAAAMLGAFGDGAHPMAMIMAGLSQLAARHHDGIDILDAACRERVALQLIAGVLSIAAMAFRASQSLPQVAPVAGESYARTFLRTTLGPDHASLEKPICERALDLILTLHADHEQNASTSTVRLAGSTGANPFAAVAAGVAALWGPAHGGANEAVIDMLEQIVSSGRPLREYIDRAKDRDSGFRLMGFGHRIYKNYDPRARIIHDTCHRLLAEFGGKQQPLLETAMELEAVALKDDYFVSRKLYPNVDFYSGIILKAIGLPRAMFTPIFALARTAGWVSHWNEMLLDGAPPIGRPRQLYTGARKRDYIPSEQRG